MKSFTRSVVCLCVLFSFPRAGTAAPFAYITNRGSNSVSVIDTATDTVTATVAVGTNPFGVAVHPDGSRVYVANVGSSTVSVIDTATNTVIATVPVAAPNPFGVAVHPDGSRVYVTKSFALENTMAVIDTATNTVIATVVVGFAPEGVAVHPDGSRVYITNINVGTLSVIDAATNTTIATVPVGSFPAGVAVHPDGSVVYVANGGSGSISVIDTATNTVTATVAVGAFPLGVAVHSDGSHAYVANRGSGSISVIDTATSTVVGTVVVGTSPEGVAAHPDGSRIYVANGGSNTVSVIDTATNSVVKTIPVGAGPIAFGNFIGPATCSTTLPFRWPTTSSASQVSQDYAQFNSPGTRRPDHYHTGMDLKSPTYGLAQQVFAVAKGEVVAVCPNGVAGGCVFDGTVFSANASNHRFQGVVILKHTLAGTGVAYSLYGHLGTVESFLPGECIDQGTLIGATGGRPDAHLHFEIKSSPVLSNPIVVSGTCTDPNDGTPSAICWGYTMVNPNTRGYYDPVEYLHLLEKNGFPKVVALSDVKDNSKTKKINARSGPGAFGNAYPVVGKAEEGSYTALSNVPGATPVPICNSGWYQIQHADNDCSVIGNCFAPNDKSTKSSVPEAWVCGDFVNE